MRLQRGYRLHTVALLVRPRGEPQERFERREFKALAKSPHHAFLLACGYAQKIYEIGTPH